MGDLGWDFVRFSIESIELIGSSGDNVAGNVAGGAYSYSTIFGGQFGPC